MTGRGLSWGQSGLREGKERKRSSVEEEIWKQRVSELEEVVRELAERGNVS